MPYIICVNTPGNLPESEPYAVITLEDARDAAFTEVQARRPEGDDYHTDPWPDLAVEAEHNVPEQGGVIGPLPDGYVIDVTRVTWDEMSNLAGASQVMGIAAEEGDAEDQAAILDAYNDHA
jgi:hypothetical protein